MQDHYTGFLKLFLFFLIAKKMNADAVNLRLTPTVETLHKQSQDIPMI